MPPPYQNLIPFFFGRDPDEEGGLEDPIKFIENVKSTIDRRTPTDAIKWPIATGVIFRLHLKGKASLWYKNLSPDIRLNWRHLEAAFISQFKIESNQSTDPNRFFNPLYNLRQNGRTIYEYVEEGDQLSLQCPEKFRRSIGRSFVTGLDDGMKMKLALHYLRHKSNLTYAQAKKAVIKAHQRLTRQNSSDTVRNYLPLRPSTSVTQSNLLASSRGPNNVPSLLPRDNTSYRPLNTSQNLTGQIQADRGIYCNHCREEGYRPASCTKSVASSAQREASRASIKNLQKAPRQYLLSHNQAQQHPKSLNQAYQYPQSFMQAHQHSQSCNQAPQYHQGFSQAHQGFSQANQGFSQAHQGFSQAHQGFSQTHQGFSQAHQGFSQTHQGFSQAQQYPQSPNQAHQNPQSLNHTYQYPQSLSQAYQYPQSLHQDHQYPQRPNQASQGLYHAFPYPQSPNQARNYPQSLNQAHKYPLSPNQANTQPPSLNQAHNTPRALIKHIDIPRQHL